MVHVTGLVRVLPLPLGSHAYHATKVSFAGRVQVLLLLALPVSTIYFWVRVVAYQIVLLPFPRSIECTTSAFLVVWAISSILAHSASFVRTAPTCSMRSVLPIARLPLGLTTPTMSTTRACCAILPAIPATAPFLKIVPLVSIPRERPIFCWRCAGRSVPKATTPIPQRGSARFVLLISAARHAD